MQQMPHGFTQHSIFPNPMQQRGMPLHSGFNIPFNTPGGFSSMPGTFPRSMPMSQPKPAPSNELILYGDTNKIKCMDGNKYVPNTRFFCGEFC